MTRRKILVAEDFSPFRELVCTQLHKWADVDVVAVGDGLAAVEAAADLQPDLALLDIGLPTMNGIEAARRIRAQFPASKIVFVTQESAPEFVDAAIELGADGYILKTRTHEYMLPVVETMLERTRRRGRHRHHAHCLEDDASLLASAERFVLGTLAAKAAAIVVLTRPHLDALAGSLRRRAVNIDRAIEQGTLRMVDATETAREITAGGASDWDGLLEGWRQSIATSGAATGQPSPRVASFSETGAVLIAAGHVETAMRLEGLADELFAADAPTLDLSCVYPMLPPARDSSFMRICAAHSLISIR